MQNYDIYKQARNMAWKFLIDNNVSELPVNLLQICKNNDYRLFLDSKCIFLNNNERGATFLKDEQWRIILNASDSVPVQRYSLAHEIGHIYLSHSLYNEKYGRSFGIQSILQTPEEYQAERFAIDILAPACVLWGLNLHTAKDISEVFNISMRAAQIRAERMEVLYKRNMFLSHPMESQVFEQFSDFIKKHKLK